MKLNSSGSGFGLEFANAGAGTETAPLDLNSDAIKVVVAHMVAEQTEALTAQVATLTDKLELAEKALADKEAEFAAFKDDLVEKAAAAERADARKAEVAKVAPALEATPERVERWASMEEAAFAAYLADVASVVTPADSSKNDSFDAKIAESAMDRSKDNKAPAEDDVDGTAARSVLGL